MLLKVRLLSLLLGLHLLHGVWLLLLLILRRWVIHVLWYTTTLIWVGPVVLSLLSHEFELLGSIDVAGGHGTVLRLVTRIILLLLLLDGTLVWAVMVEHSSIGVVTTTANV